MTAIDNRQDDASKEKKALDVLEAWRHADKASIAQKGDSGARMKEYQQRGKLRSAADQLPPRKMEGSAP